MMQRRVRFAAVLIVVVFALSGFSTSSHGGKSGKSGKSSSSSGGGCSNSKKSNNSYHHNDYDDDYDSSSSSSGGSTYATPTATASDAPRVRVIRCAQPRKGKLKAVTSSTVELTSADSGTYDVDVTFLDTGGNIVDTGETTVDVESGESKTLTVSMDSPSKVSKVWRCQVTAEPGN